jgi:5-methyltetrahydrofolate--homocysteine methyltransferase
MLFDGGMGSMLIAQGLAAGSAPEEWNRSHASIIRDIHLAYLAAGADVINTNTFGGTPGKLASHNLAGDLRELNQAGVTLAREAIEQFEIRTDLPEADLPIRDKQHYLSLSVGPTGKMLPPVGDATEEEIHAEFSAQLECVKDDVDLVLIETIYDLREAVIALDAARTTVSVPVGLTLTFDKKARGFFTLMGNEAVRSIQTIGDLGADFVGANCTLTSGDMLELAGLIRHATALPVVMQPNAGQPAIRKGMPVYDQKPEEYAADMIEMLAIGINAVGGCCGTTPEFIRTLRMKMKEDNRAMGPDTFCYDDENDSARP